MTDIQDLKLKIAKSINENIGQKIEFHSETQVYKNGQQCHFVIFEGTLAKIHNSFIRLVEFFVPLDVASRMIELYIRQFGITNVPKLTKLEEKELSGIEKAFKARQEGFEKRLQQEIEGKLTF
jgi:hypothetical protein